jgi:uncharacterized membrane protein YecN with MAPEG domain
MNVPVTLLYGGLTALLVTLLGLNVSLKRLQGKVRPSQPIPPELHRAWRAHGNAAEWIPLGLVLLLTLELTGRVPRFPLHLLGGTFFLARALHAASRLTSLRSGTLGAGLNYLVLVVMAVLALWFRFSM